MKKIPQSVYGYILLAVSGVVVKTSGDAILKGAALTYLGENGTEIALPFEPPAAPPVEPPVEKPLAAVPKKPTGNGRVSKE
jgi:hypothetical protein